VFGHLTYLVFELAWAIPVLALQWLVGFRVLARSLRVICMGVLVPTIYLTIADGIAIHAGIWHFHSNRIIGLTLARVPVEEIVFFIVTNVMIVQTVVLIPAMRELRPRWTMPDRLGLGR
jgi:lycopene cyclase domain-containing protein